jgi:hypothetical protein
MNKAQLTEALKAKGFEARPELQVAELKAIHDGLLAAEKAAALEGIVADMQSTIETLGATAEKAPKTVIATLGERKFEVEIHAAILPGYGKVTAEEIAASEELVEAILQIEGHNILKEL